MSEDLATLQAKYVNDIRNTFSSLMPSQEEREYEIKAHLQYGEGVPVPPKNPKVFAETYKAGDLSEREILALTLQAEAGGEGKLGMLAAGAVIDNRVKAGDYGGSVTEVILAPGQFSAWNSLTGYAGGEGGLDMSTIKPSKTAYEVADMILSGAYESPVGKATHYYNPEAADPKWGKRAGGDWLTIGNHVFGYGN